MQTFDSPVKVATVVADSTVHESGVHVYHSYTQPMYQVPKKKRFEEKRVGSEGMPSERRAFMFISTNEIEGDVDQEEVALYSRWRTCFLAF